MSTQKGLVVERILRDRESIWRQVVDEHRLGRLTGSMFLTSVLCLAAYGAVLGASNSWMQAISSAIKLPLLFLATLVICLPTLYLFNLIFGARLSMSQAIALIMSCITVMAVLVLAFAPISLFFLITADNYEFFKLLNVAILVLAAIVGLRFLTSGMSRLNEQQAVLTAERERQEAAAAASAVTASGDASAVLSEAAPEGNGAGGSIAVLPKAPAVTAASAPRLPAYSAPPARPTSMTLLYIWIALFGFVGTQLAWTLRPFFGSPDQKFEPFREIEGTFYADIMSTIGNLFGG